jgi:aminoglycoside/choline kinase family phosphotransferase
MQSTTDSAQLRLQLSALFAAAFGAPPAFIHDLRADGSDRKLYRLVGHDAATAVGVFGPEPEENRAFLSYSRSLRSVGLPVPEIYAAHEAARIYLEEDLGDTTLYDLLCQMRAGDDFPESIIPLYHQVIRLLPQIQIRGGESVDYSVAWPYPEFDRRAMMWDLNYFKYHSLKLAQTPFHEGRLEEDFERLCDFLLGADRSHFLYRDFQSRNIMVRGGKPWLIDYQGGRRGALQYDVASLLYDAKAAIPQAVRQQFLECYLDALEEIIPVEREKFRHQFRGFALVRILQAMGAYGYRGWFQRKEHFLSSIPYALANLTQLFADGLPVELPELKKAVEALSHVVSQDEENRSEENSGERNSGERNGGERNGVANSAPSTQGSEAAAQSPTSRLPDPRFPIPDPRPPALTVHITSFSYKRGGYPADDTGHGGGFVFDCRSLHNPGRYPEYRQLTGQDQPVIEFLEREEEVERFWDDVRDLAERAVSRYLERGFSHISVAFGCTGGQHRSVYFAERLAKHFRDEALGASIDLHHREATNWPVVAGRQLTHPPPAESPLE